VSEVRSAYICSVYEGERNIRRESEASQARKLHLLKHRRKEDGGIPIDGMPPFFFILMKFFPYQNYYDQKDYVAVYL
jgi:hypothetical protein